MAIPIPKSASPKGKHESPSVGEPLKIKKGRVKGQGERIGIYGSGGIGKTELAAGLKVVGINPIFIDLDSGSSGLDVDRIGYGDNLSFQDIRSFLQADYWHGDYGAVVIDTFTALEEIIAEHVIEFVPHEKATKTINNLEDYGWGKGQVHVFEHALLVLQDLDALARKGIHVIIICHQVAERVPSAESEDYLEYQPRMQSPNKTAKIRERVFEWTNHFFRVDHDRAVTDGKAIKADSRSIFTVRNTTSWAKHRTLASGKQMPDRVDYEKGSVELWKIMFGGNE